MNSVLRLSERLSDRMRDAQMIGTGGPYTVGIHWADEVEKLERLLDESIFWHEGDRSPRAQLELSSHTAGPWIVVKEIQLDDDGISTVPIFGPEGSGYGRVGTAYAEIGRGDELWPNAILQAAAPELLDVARAEYGHAKDLYVEMNDEFYEADFRDWLQQEAPELAALPDWITESPD